MAVLDRGKQVSFRFAQPGLSLASETGGRSTAELGHTPASRVMAEGFELVRTIRQHVRRSAALLDEGRLDDALAAADSALALDPQSLPAQALRDRIFTAKAAQAAAARPEPDRHAKTSRSFVPHGVNAASWHGFEQRITERRFRALLDTINASIVAGDAIAAREALEEARELRPDAPELPDVGARVSAVPVAPPVVEVVPASRIWVRAMGAAALFLVGVSLLLGLEWMGPGEPAATVPMAAPEVPVVAPAPEPPPAVTPDLGPVPVAMNDEEESVPAIVTPPEPLLRPNPTTDTTSAPELAARPVAMREALPPPVERTIEREAIDEDVPVRSGGEVSDDYVASPRNAPVPTSDPERAAAPPSRPADTPVTADTRGRAAPPAASVASAVVIPAVEQGRVEEVLRRYARAYGELDASAARAVWPTVDEKALARAFQNLASQNVSFDDCDIDIRGVVANASCRGQSSYVGKVGSREPRIEPRTWRFELRRDGDAWRIENAEARRQSGAEYR